MSPLAQSNLLSAVSRARARSPAFLAGVSFALSLAAGSCGPGAETPAPSPEEATSAVARPNVEGTLPPLGGGSTTTTTSPDDGAGDRESAPPGVPTGDGSPTNDGAPSDDAAPAPAAVYDVNDANSLALGQIWRASTLLSGFAHDHVVRATSWAGLVRYAPGDLSSCAVSITIATAGLLNDEADVRAHVGLEGTVGDGDRAEIREHMLAADQLDAERHPEITFRSTSCAAVDGAADPSGATGQLLVEGDVTIRGVSKRVAWPVDFAIEDGALVAHGAIDVVHADFGIEPYSAFFGAVKNGEAIRIAFDIRGALR